MVNSNSYILSGSTRISISSLPSMFAIGSRIVLLVGFILLSRFLIIWTRVKVKSILLVLISSLRVITFSFLLVNLAIVSFDEKLSYRVSCVFSFLQLFYLGC